MPVELWMKDIIISIYPEGGFDLEINVFILNFWLKDHNL